MSLPLFEPETPLSALHTPELFLLTTLRLWVREHAHPKTCPGNWRDGFAAAGIGPFGISAFGALMGGVVAATPGRPLDMRCLCCQVLGRDEAALLTLVSALQKCRPANAQAILADWLPPAAIRFALPAAEGLAAALAKAGLVVAPRCATADLLRSRAPALYANPGLGLVQ